MNMTSILVRMFGRIINLCLFVWHRLQGRIIYSLLPTYTDSENIPLFLLNMIVWVPWMWKNIVFNSSAFSITILRQNYFLSLSTFSFAECGWIIVHVRYSSIFTYPKSTFTAFVEWEIHVQHLNFHLFQDYFCCLCF